MFLLYGKRSLIIKKYTDHTHACPHCRGLNLEVKVEKYYYHLFYIPFFPSRGKFAHVTCGNCGKPYKDPVLEEDYYVELEDEYEKRTKTPIYLYSGLILVGLLTLFMVFSNLRTQKQKAEYVAKPQTGDTYLIREKRADHKVYYYLSVYRISGDSVFTHPGHLEYPGFTRKMKKGDYFETNLVRPYTKQQLKQMLDDGMIIKAEREKAK
jgi:hypothetical protein